MSIRRYLYHLFCIAIFCTVLVPEIIFGQGNQLGRYPVYNFSPKTYNALPQILSVVQDQRGIMYFGNNLGVLEYDGENWTLIPPTDGSTVHSMAVDEKGRVYFGSQDEFGYLVSDSVGRMRYFLLSDQLDEEHKNFNEIWKTHATNMGIIYQAYHNLFIFSGDSIQVIESEEEIHESFYVRETLFISYGESGIGYLSEDRIVPIKSGIIFEESSIYGMLELGGDNILIVTEMDGFFNLAFPEDDPEKAVISKVRTNSDLLFSKLEIYNALRISPNRISIGTWGYGVVIIDSLYDVVAVIDKEAGLQDQIIQGQYVDTSGNLWLALSSGISRVEVQSALTQFSDSEGLRGTVQSLTRFNGRIYATTNVGLFYMDQEFYNEDLAQFKQPVFKPDEGANVDVECWDMITYRNNNEEILLVVTNTDIFELTQEQDYEVILEDDIYTLYQSKLDPNRIYIGLANGLTSIYREDGKWIKEKIIPEIEDMILNISEDHMGNVWMGTPEENLYKMHIQSFEGHTISSYSVNRYTVENGLPSGPFIISQFKGPPTIATNEGLFKFNMIEESFKPDSSYGDQFGDGSLYIHRISEFQQPEIWMVTFSEDAKQFKYKVGYLEEEQPGYYTFVTEPFNRLSEEIIHAIYQDNGGVVWLGGSQGLFRFQKEISRDYKKDYNAFIRGVELSDGSSIFGGTYMNDQDIQSLTQPDALKLILPFRENDLVFNYSAQPSSDESFTRYSYYLEGNDNTWSEWTDEKYRPYTNLREGKYTFRVKARNVHDHISNEATFEFTIIAPWYRKWWAFILYIILATGIVYFIVKVYTRQLREIIRERTAEVVAQKEVIEEKNKDIMDSIQYAKKIQQALLPPEDDLSKLDLDGFILFLPRDVVSGDFYWISKHKGKIITVAADCTGHGVPGAFMSMLGVAFLNNIVEAQGIVNSGEILNELRAEVISALKQKGQEGEQKDGMDVALHVIDYDKMTIDFAGANNPLILIRESEIIQVKADRMPIGIHQRATESFTSHKMAAKKGDVIYTFSDGFQDQFGGPKNKKFMIKRMKDLLLDIHKKPMDEQKAILKKAFFDWIDPYDVEQIDDVILIGVRI